MSGRRVLRDVDVDVEEEEEVEDERRESSGRSGMPGTLRRKLERRRVRLLWREMLGPP